jgi:prepilin-type N-terminal cleavage/methylation domain-containing protein
MRAPKRDAGFSLIEIMVAILILGIALVGLTQGITSSLTASKESELQTTAALIAAGLQGRVGQDRRSALPAHELDPGRGRQVA